MNTTGSPFNPASTISPPGLIISRFLAKSAWVAVAGAMYRRSTFKPCFVNRPLSVAIHNGANAPLIAA